MLPVSPRALANPNPDFQTIRFVLRDFAYLDFGRSDLVGGTHPAAHLRPGNTGSIGGVLLRFCQFRSDTIGHQRRFRDKGSNTSSAMEVLCEDSRRFYAPDGFLACVWPE